MAEFVVQVIQDPGLRASRPDMCDRGYATNIVQGAPFHTECFRLIWKCVVDTCATFWAKGAHLFDSAVSLRFPC